MDSEKKDIQPCPFYGSTDVNVNDLSCYFSSEFAVFCNSCGAMGAPHDYQDSAANAWNQRFSQDGDL